MAGGPLAQEAICYVCLDEGKVTKANRVYEGAEDDQYVCEQGHHFGVDYRKGPAETAQWPPDPKLVEAFTKTN